MKLLDYAEYDDFGKEWYVQIFSNHPKFALIDLCIQWDEFPSTEIFPYLLISIGAHSLFGFSLRYKWCEIRADFIQFRPRNLAAYRLYREENPDTFTSADIRSD